MTDTAAARSARDIAIAYIEAVGRGDLTVLDDLFADDLVARMAGNVYSKQEWLAALRRLLPALKRNEIRHASADGDTACVVYDFVTNTPAGAVPCVEIVTTASGTIREIELIFDRVAFAPVNESLRGHAPA